MGFLSQAFGFIVTYESFAITFLAPSALQE
jgi:hypothetical protein